MVVFFEVVDGFFCLFVGDVVDGDVVIGEIGEVFLDGYCEV